jgi:hypothetical protein
MRSSSLRKVLSLRDLRIETRWNDSPDDVGACTEVAFKFDSEPTPELAGIAYRVPDAVERRTRHNTLLVPIGG